jgi:hypothetical protein
VRRLLIILVPVVVFLGISFVVARVLAALSAERSAATELVTFEGHGATRATVGRVSGCAGRPACVKRVQGIVSRVRGPGEVQILNIVSGTSFGLGGSEGVARVAWTRKGRELPFVQCLLVRRTGDPIGGFAIHLLAVSAPIGREASCPKTANVHFTPL